MRCHIYLRKGRVFIPTFGLVDRGLYRDIEPVAVLDVSETEALRFSRDDRKGQSTDRTLSAALSTASRGQIRWREKLGRFARRFALDYWRARWPLSDRWPPEGTEQFRRGPRPISRFSTEHNTRSGDRPYDWHPAGHCAEKPRHLSPSLVHEPRDRSHRSGDPLFELLLRRRADLA